MKIGLKLWSTNEHYIPVARDLFTHKVFDYIELFMVPGSMATIPRWKELGISYVLHAPHSGMGLNPANPGLRDTNIEMVSQVDTFFSALSPDFVIFHPGVNGDLEESISQFHFFGERFPRMHQKVVIENNPQLGLNNEKCLGAIPAEIRKLSQDTGLGFCFDFVHAICSAQSNNLEWEAVAKDFLSLLPVIYHVSDSHYAEKDLHKHLGEGELDLLKIFKMLPADCLVTLETPKNSQNDLDDFTKDAEFFRFSLNDKMRNLAVKKCLH